MLAAAAGHAAEPVRIASKNSNESYLLSEIAAQLLESKGVAVERRFGLGGTLIAFDALVAGEIDLYMEYTGTLSQAILKLGHEASREAMNRRLEGDGLRLLRPFGFNNTYAIAVRRGQAQALGLARIGDLAGHPALKLVFSHEFLEREDGWPGLKRAYGLPLRATGIEHALAYQAIAAGSVDVTDAYSTDGELLRHDLVLLEDDRNFFPQYLAAPLVRADVGAAVIEALETLGDSLDDGAAQALNAAVVVDGLSFAEVAAGFLAERGLAAGAVVAAGGDDLWRSLAANTVQHLKLTLTALGAAVAVGLLLSLLIFRRAVAARLVVYFCGLLQTVPSIALLALMIPLFGIGAAPAVVALFLYSLLPVVRNTVTALTTIDPSLLRVADAMGLSRREQIRHVYLPLSMPSVLAGIRTAAVINIGTATLAAFIGAGGLGDPIVTGLALNDVAFILQGAVPAALLAIATELAFEGVERVAVPGHLRAR
ncbi:MAG: ABC transporter permease subunit [Gammaproteobacteria bacterium]|nr:ABC transporter permease subunit [Gammaproteobacteria bacterium]